MLQTYIENGKTYTDYPLLSKWARNPKYLLKEDHDRTENQILDLGQYKPLLVLAEEANVKGEVFPEGAVIGGNGRHQIYGEQIEKGETKFSKPWVSLLGFKFIEEDAMWYPVVNGEVQSRRKFADPLQIMIEYALSDNDQSGTTDKQALKELAHPYRQLMPMQQYKFQVYNPQPLQSLMDEDTDKKEVRDDSKKEKEEQELIYLSAKFTPEQFKEVEPIVEAAKEKLKTTNNTDLITRLLNFWLDNNERDEEIRETIQAAIDTSPGGIMAADSPDETV
jgi:hypothetical protein